MNFQISDKRIAQLTGASLVLMAIIAGLTMGLVFNSLFTSNITQFKNHLTKLIPAFNWGVVAWIVILILDVFVSWGLYLFYKTKNYKKSIYMGGLRFLYSIVLGISIYKLIQAAFLIDNVDVNYNLIFTKIHHFQAIWQFGLIIFGMHLVILATLVCEKQILLRTLSILLLLAGVGYILSNVANIFINNYEEYRARVEAVFIIPMIFGELGLAFWLILKGGSKTIAFAK